jgi:hypothetical protein
MEHLINRQGSRLPHTLYLVVVMVVVGLASRIKKLVKCLDTAILSIGCPNVLYYIALLFLWDRLLQLHFSKSK